MGALKDQLKADLVTAMKAKDDAAKSNIRMALAALHTEEVAGDTALWQRMRASELAAAPVEEITFRREMQLREILAHDIPAVLRVLGYRTPPPPPAEHHQEGHCCHE